MKKPNGYDEVQINEPSKQLPAGNYICKILNVEETFSKKSQPILIVSVDIAEGEYKDFFKKAYQENKDAQKKWPIGGRKYTLIEDANGMATEQYKKFLVYTEKSNNFQIDWARDWDQLKGKLIGASFRREQFLGNNGPAFSTRLCWFHTIDQIRKGELDIPEDKLLPSYQQGASAELEDDLPF